MYIYIYVCIYIYIYIYHLKKDNEQQIIDEFRLI